MTTYCTRIIPTASSDTGIRAVILLCLVREVAVWLIDVSGRYDNISEYLDERGFHAENGKFVV